ncbi:fasciclin-2-like isoform X1 [Macrosteles quadrilineatus]|uniref:fasciclin-2-like isoform X1 n=1 Tax=Macrosteles quadrilineatus TaxID=74068 RepID=UPI0023E263CA|nr:fasciclin-2-like isoform X1 [Macrosteles quadrilineatus]
MPAMPVQAKPIGKKVLLTCRAPDDKNLITELRWLDPQNNTIRNDNILTRDRLSVEKMTPDTLALIFSSLKDSEAGVYTCTAVYAGSKTISKSVRIDTIYAITWIDAPEEQYPIMGSKYKVKCKVQANPSPIVDWLRNGQQIQSTNNDRYVIDNDGLVIKNVTEDDDGIYICRAIVLDTGELSERNIKVEVHIPPSFDDKMPTTVEVVEGESASVTCMARGKPKPHYSWIRSDNDLNLASSGRSTVNENTGVLTITRVSKEDNGEIRCMAANAAGSMERVVNLVVVIKPQVMDIKNITLPIRSRARLVCRATGNPEPSITFWKIGAPLEMVKGSQPADPRIVVENRVGSDGITEAHLIIDELTRPDDGLYTCIARNKGGESRKNGHLTVEFPPNFDNTPIKEAWSWNRLPVNLTCLAESIPNATITWKLNERDIERDPNFKKFGNGPWSSLLVTPVDLKYYGVYKCTARNVHGEVWHTIKLTEATAPGQILQAILDVITATTITFSFKGPSSNGGRPIKAFQVQYKGEYQQWTEARNKTWAYGSPYILEGLAPQTTYVFRFAAINDVGMSNWAAQQTVVMPKRSFPEEPKILHPTLGEEKYIVSPYHNKYELAWRIPADNGEPIDRYDIKYCQVQKVSNEWVETEEPCVIVEHRSLEVASYELRGLHSDTFYKVEIRAHNIIGFSVPGQLVVKTARGSDDNGPAKHSDPHLSSTTIISIVVAALLIILVIVDVSCFFVNDTGILHIMCGKSKKNKNDDDAKLGSEGKELLNNGHRDLKVQIESAPMLDKKDTTVEFDLKKATSKTSFVGKDSAV